MLFQYWPTVFDAGPTVKQHWVNASCLLGCICRPDTEFMRLCLYVYLQGVVYLHTRGYLSLQI